MSELNHQFICIEKLLLETQKKAYHIYIIVDSAFCVSLSLFEHFGIPQNVFKNEMKACRDVSKNFWRVLKFFCMDETF